MQKTINFLKTNYLAKGLVFLVLFIITDLILSYVGLRNGTFKSDLWLREGLKGVLAIISMIFFVFSAIKENKDKLILKIISVGFVTLLAFWLIDKIIFLIK